MVGASQGMFIFKSVKDAIDYIFFRPTPYGFRQVVQHVSKHVAYGIID